MSNFWQGVGRTWVFRNLVPKLLPPVYVVWLPIRCWLVKRRFRFIGLCLYYIPILYFILSHCTWGGTWKFRFMAQLTSRREVLRKLHCIQDVTFNVTDCQDWIYAQVTMEHEKYVNWDVHSDSLGTRERQFLEVTLTPCSCLSVFSARLQKRMKHT